MADIQANFENGTLNTLKKILSQNKALDIKYEHNGENDPYFTHTVSSKGVEIFYLKYAIPGKADDSTLRIDGKIQKWSPGAVKELHDAVNRAWWEKEHAKKVAKEQEEAAKIQQEQNEITSFLSGFLR